MSRSGFQALSAILAATNLLGCAASAQSETIIPPLPPQVLTPTDREAEVAVVLADGAVQRFGFVGVADRLIDIQLTNPSEEIVLDPFLTLFKGGGEVATDDDSGGNLASHIRFALTEGGDFEIAASELAGRAGSLVMRYRLLPIPPIVNHDLPTSGATLTAAIDDDAPFLSQPGSSYLMRFRQYRFADLDIAALRASGQVLYVDMQSETLDAVLELGFDTPFGFSTVARGDDFDCTSNARIVIDPEVIDSRFYNADLPTWTGQVRLRASGLGQGTGDYRLSVQKAARDAPQALLGCAAADAEMTSAEQAADEAQFEAAVAAAQAAVDSAARAE